MGLEKLFGRDNASKGNKDFQKAKAIYERAAQTKPANLEEGIALARRAREEFHSAKTAGSIDEAYALNLEASIHRLRLDIGKSISCHEEAIAIVDKVDPHDASRAEFLSNLADLHRTRYGVKQTGSDLLMALKYALNAVDEYKARHPSHSGFIVSLHNLGLVCRDFGNFETAEQLLKMSSALAAVVGDRKMADLSRYCYDDIQTAKTQLSGYNLIRDVAYGHLSRSQQNEAEKLLLEAKVISEFKK